MRSRLSTLIAVFTIAGVLAAPMAVAAMHRDCVRQTGCGHHSSLTSRCCVVTTPHITPPAIVSAPTESPMADPAATAAVFPWAGYGVALVRMPARDDTSPSRRALDLPTLFGTLLI